MNCDRCGQWVGIASNGELARHNDPKTGRTCT